MTPTPEQISADLKAAGIDMTEPNKRLREMVDTSEREDGRAVDEWFQGQPPSMGYYLVTWIRKGSTPTVSELFFCDQHGGRWWTVRAYIHEISSEDERIRSERIEASLMREIKTVVAWRSLPSPALNINISAGA